jgi:CRP-like cAMP-binding protein
VKSNNKQPGISDTVAFLRDNPLFIGVSEPTISTIVKLINLKKGRKGQIVRLASPDQQVGKILLLLEGRMKLYQLDMNLEQRISDVVFAGDVYSPHSASDSNEFLLVDTKEARFCLVNASEWQHILLQDETLLGNYLRVIHQRIQKLEFRYQNIAAADSRLRVIRLLTDLVTRQGGGVEDHGCVENFLTHQEIANLLLMSRQSVFTAFEKLKSEGVLFYSRKAIILRPDLLSKMRNEAAVRQKHLLIR